MRRSTLPERVFGRRGTTTTVLSAATGPIVARTRAMTSPAIPSGAAPAPSTSVTNAAGTTPLSASGTPTTAHSATAGWAQTTSSIAPADRRCPATFITSSLRPSTQTPPPGST